ncbi:unnamed protein product, partial [Arabidopsis halleri]
QQTTSSSLFSITFSSLSSNFSCACLIKDEIPTTSSSKLISFFFSGDSQDVFLLCWSTMLSKLTI